MLSDFKVLKSGGMFASVAGIYFALGMLGTLFNIEPGFASAIWPAAGWAIAAVIAFGNRAIIPLFIGSLITNLVNSGALGWSFYVEWNDLFWNAVRSGGAVLQAYFGYYLLKKFCRFPLDLNDGNTLLRSLFLASPVACVISAAIGTYSLYIQGIVAPISLPFVWFTWWVGDAVGILFFFPIFLGFLSGNNHSQLSHRYWVSTAAFGLFILVCGTFNYSRSVYYESLSNRFNNMAEQQVAAMQILKSTIENNLFGLAALIQANQNMSILEFEQYTRLMSEDFALYRAMGWLPAIKQSQIPQWQQDLVVKGVLEAQVKQAPGSAALKEPFFPISLIAPFKENQRAVGLDVLSHPIAGAAAQQAIVSRSPIATAPLSLAQQHNKATGNVIYYPVYAVNDPQQLLGLVEVVIEVDVIIERLLAQNKNTGYFEYTLYDTDREQLWYSNAGEASHKAHQLHFMSEFEVDWFGRNWLLHFDSTQSFEQVNKDWLSWLTLIIGLIVAALGMSFTIILTGFNKQLKQQVDKQTTRLAELVNKLKQADKVKSEFLANMSHEIRTPLNSILGTLQVLLRGSLNERDHELVSNALLSSRTLLAILNDILDLSKLEAGKVAIESTPFNLTRVVEQEVASHQKSALEKSIKLSLTCDVMLNPYRLGDSVRLKQILQNLLSNAVKFTSQGEITLTLSEMDKPDWVRITVSDTGIGLSEEQLSRLFQRFEQADSSTTRKYGGTGLGMPITKQLIGLMGGHIKVQSKLEQGSQFIVDLPFPLVEKTQVKDVPSADHQAPNLADFKILVAEDNHINKVVIKAMLAPTQANLDFAENGVIATQQVAQQHYDLVLMDIQMPVMDGLEACEIIKQTHPDLPIIALTANVMEHDIRKYLEAGFDAHIGKPVEANELMALLNQTLLTRSIGI